jgi:hypothetical protein
MTDFPKKNDFEWKEGETLDDATFSPLGDIRAHGLPKINKAIANDPATRKQEREKLLVEKQSQPYKNQIEKKKDEDFVMDESASGISDLSDKKEQEAKRLIEKGNQSKGFDRFGKK